MYVIGRVVAGQVFLQKIYCRKINQIIYKKTTGDLHKNGITYIEDVITVSYFLAIHLKELFSTVHFHPNGSTISKN